MYFKIFNSCLIAVITAFLIFNVHSIQAQEDTTLPRVDYRISVVSDDIAELGEGPYWSPDENALYYVDAYAGDFCRLNVETKDVSRRNIPGLVSMIIPYSLEDKVFIVSNRNKLYKLNWESNSTELLAELNPELEGLERFNDAKCDPRGRLFIGTVLERKEGWPPVAEGGSLYRFEGGDFTKVTTGFTLSNGLAWSSDAKKLYMNDSEGRKIFVFDYDIETGTVSNKTLFINCDESNDFVSEEYPDGMAIDEYGFIWVAMYNGGRIVKINPNTARVVDGIIIENAKVPSSLAFGNYKGNYGMYVTTAKSDIGSDSGKILHVDLVGGKVHGFKPSTSGSNTIRPIF